MTNHYQKITIIKIRKPVRNEINEELQWLGASLGLFNLRDKDRSCFRIFVELLKSSKIGKGLSSDEIAFKSGLSRGTVIHHINKLIESGLVAVEQRKYILREAKLEPLIDEIEKDLVRYLDGLRSIARDIDNKLK
ncbi:winged helix-turn-helix domain-containing protein [Candidatus Woesearchaeota archaeon]|jgi:predicted transcriptional regulator|nr:winged helix-turn-helix domain-containing protein [Candidatus Woesearchaeota archaeon]